MASHVVMWKRIYSNHGRLDCAMKAITQYQLLFSSCYKRSMCVKSGDEGNVSALLEDKNQQNHQTEMKTENPESKKNNEDRNIVNSSRNSFFSAYQKFSSDEVLNPAEPIVREESFATMFRKSKFVDLGDPKGKLVIGKIYHIVGDDLYVDFGWKFPCVLQRPATNSGLYVRNAQVRLRINELELSTRFLGSSTEMSLNEADCTLVGLVHSPLGLGQKRR